MLGLVDWMPYGRLLLGFTDAGSDLATSQRWLLRTASARYPLFVVARVAWMLLASSGHGL